MEKIINIGDKSIKLNNNIGWALAYRDQFGRDVIPSMMPLVASALDLMAGVINETGKTKDIKIEDLLAVFDGDAIINAAIHLGGLELVDFLNITWALNKCADDTIPEPKEWVKQFDTFPLDEIAPAVFSLIFKGLISAKNLQRLEGIKEKLQPTTKA